MLVRNQIPTEYEEELTRSPKEMREEGIKLISSAASAGIAEAQFALAMLAKPPTQDFKERGGEAKVGGREDTIRWLRRAAVQGHLLAANNLGVQYVISGNSKDAQSALRWLQHAARRGLCGAMLNLARTYADGFFDAVHLPNSKSKLKEKERMGLGLKWCHKAADEKSAEAIYALGVAYKLGLKEVLEIDLEKAARLFERAANLDSPDAARALGTCYYNGQGVVVDFQKAFECYHRAATLGDSGAMFKLSQLYDSGLGVKLSKSTALTWFNKGAHVMQERTGQFRKENEYAEMATWGGLHKLSQRKLDKNMRDHNVDEGPQGHDEDAMAEKEKFEAWCSISTPRQIGLFHEFQSEMNEAV